KTRPQITGEKLIPILYHHGDERDARISGSVIDENMNRFPALSDLLNPAGNLILFEQIHPRKRNRACQFLLQGLPGFYIDVAEKNARALFVQRPHGSSPNPVGPAGE